MSDEQPENVKELILEILFGILIFVSDEHSEKAPLPISVTLFGIVTLIRLRYPAKEKRQIFVIFRGMTKFVIIMQ